MSWAARSALRSSRLSLGPASVLRRARASDAVMGAGVTGPFLPLRRAALRLGVGRPLGPVLRRASVPNRSRPPLALSSDVARSTTTSWLPFLHWRNHWRDFSIQRHRGFQRDQRPAVADVARESFIEPSRFLLQTPDFNFNSGCAQLLKSATAHLRIWICH